MRLCKAMLETRIKLSSNTKKGKHMQIRKKDSEKVYQHENKRNS